MSATGRHPARVLVLDAEARARQAHSDELRREGFSTQEAGTAHSAALALADFDPDLVLLEIALPDASGLEFARQVRDERPGTGLIVVSRARGIDEVLAGLEVADDYLTKPVRPRELIARVRAVLRRSPASEGVLRFADVTLNEHTREVLRGGQPLDLTPREFDLLRFLMLNPRRVLSKEQILTHVWHAAGSQGDGRAVETYVSYLRKKLDAHGPPLIRTIRLVGYSLTEG